MLASKTSESVSPVICRPVREGANEVEIAALEHRVRSLSRQLAAANQELETFAYSVSHDLRAPLRSIRGFSEALLDRNAAQLDERGKEFLCRVKEASQQMDKLLEELLKFSRLGRSEFNARPVNLSALAEELAQELRLIEPGRSVQFIIAPELCAHGDEKLLRIVLKQLLANAWKFSSQKPQARIEFGVRPSSGADSPHDFNEPAWASKLAAHEDGRAPESERAYFVRDNGAGFDPANVGRLFGVFQRLHGADEFPGPGMGLATVQHIIYRHGGRVWATGALEQGATFYFTLPSNQAETQEL